MSDADHIRLGFGAWIDVLERPAPPLSEQELSAVAALVRGHAGLTVHPRGDSPLRQAVAQRMLWLGLASTSEYLGFIGGQGGQEELTRLVAHLVVQKTSFFRDRGQFEMFEKRLLPELRLRKGGRGRLRVWSAGCSTGQEPYSIAMALRRLHLDALGAKVLASDIHRQGLDQARDGLYREKDVADLSPEELSFFMHDPQGRRIRDDVRSLVDFRFHNLASVPFPIPEDGPWDAIFCRNVLIYFNRETVQEIVSRFRGVLADGGYLLLGSSESLFKISEGFEAIPGEKAFVYRKCDRKAAVLPPAAKAATPMPTAVDRARVRPVPAPPPGAGPIAGAQDFASSLLQAKALLEAKKEEQAARQLFALTRERPGEPEPYQILGKIALARGALEEAESWYLAAIQMNPLDIESRFLLALILYRLEEFAEAAEQLRRLLFLEGRFSLGHFYLGVVAEKLGDVEAAARSFRNGLQSCAAFPVGQVGALLERHHLSQDELAAACRSRLERLGGKESAG